jgi:hypothetical protein
MSDSRSWARSLYWRIGFGFILFLAITLGLQAALFIWVAGVTEGFMPERMGRDFAELVASEFEAAVARDPTLDLEAYAKKRINELHRPAVIIFADGRTSRRRERTCRGACGYRDRSASDPTHAPAIVAGRRCRAAARLREEGRPPTRFRACRLVGRAAGR